MIVKVTKEHIKKGRRASCTTCPIALALHSSGFTNAVVGPRCWYEFLNSPEGHKLNLSAKKFIRDFDNARPVKPFSFRFRKPENISK